MRTFSHLTRKQRIILEHMYNSKSSIKDIANKLKVHISTVYRELKRGTFIKRNTYYEYVTSYSGDLAQERYENLMQAKGVSIKLGNDHNYANYIEKKIVDEKYSPKAILEEIKRENISFKTTICFKTLYNYIDKGVFLRLTNKELPVKAYKRRKYKRVREKKESVLGESIEKRPSEINERDTFGHWEMDTVIGKKSSKYCLLVLTERTTRKELIRKMPGKKASNVVYEIDKLENEYGSMFSKIFKTITVDNGCEFAKCSEMENSILNPGKKRVKIYYCHPYTSWERGSNEVANRLIRRFLPKSNSFDHVPEEHIKYIECWMNNYPRSIFGYRTAEQMYQEELSGFT
ncbi:MAG: IS30 family transposase [Erysipelotrichaceae bacterium]|nr:IS30 family transposase [Erysipelotrichaceae bacterium]